MESVTSSASPDPESRLRDRSLEVSDRPLTGLLRVSSLTLVSRIFGFVRDAAMATKFGNGPILDAFTVASVSRTSPDDSSVKQHFRRHSCQSSFESCMKEGVTRGGASQLPS